MLAFLYLTFALLLYAPAPQPAGLIAVVRAAVARGDFARAEALIAADRKQHGVTPELAEAVSWLGRGALASKALDKADAYAAEARKYALSLLHGRTLDAERHLPIALGASIEVQAQVLTAKGERGEAVSFLQRELETWHDTSIRTRIQKNIHLLSLAGKPAPPLDVNQWLGPKPPPAGTWKGHPVLLFFWAHWCGDCKAEAGELAKVAAEYAPKGLILIGPTQRYGYAAAGQEATPEQELRYIDQVRTRYYSELRNMPVPVSEENFRSYGASTTPTLVLIDQKGIVRLFHPGALPYAEIAKQVELVLAN